MSWITLGEATERAMQTAKCEMEKRRVEREWDGSPPHIAGVPISRELAEKLGTAAE
jgi:hypothetical protein